MFTVKIETDNAAFQNGNMDAEIHRILGRLRGMIADGDVRRAAGEERGVTLCDVNGNTVGEARFTR